MTAISVTAPTLESIRDRIVQAADRGQALEVLGSGGKRGYGRTVHGAEPLSTAGLAGVVDYQPRELLVVVRPGTPLQELERVLAGEGQRLAFEPPHWGAGATIGGVVGANLSGPRRFRAGAARDHLLGFQAVTGRGETIRGGGKVVKNVTGYDLSKLMCGSFGTLAVFTELCLKVLPAAEAECTAIVPVQDVRLGLNLLGVSAHSTQEPTGLALLPPHAELPQALQGFSQPSGTRASLALLRVEGPGSAEGGSVRQRVQALLAQPAARQSGRTEVLEGAASRSVWQAVRELEPVLPRAAVPAGQRLWRLTVAPAAAAVTLQRLGEAVGGPPQHWFADWAGGLIWALLPEQAEPHSVLALLGGHARLVRSAAPPPETLRCFPPLSPPLRGLHENLKRAFDPAGVLNPGRMYQGL